VFHLNMMDHHGPFSILTPPPKIVRNLYLLYLSLPRPSLAQASNFKVASLLHLIPMRPFIAYSVLVLLKYPPSSVARCTLLEWTTYHGLLFDKCP
jgi:hypothetical protein